MTNNAQPRRGSGSVVWALITGLAVGFAVGRETGPGRRAASDDSGEAAAAAPAADSPPSAKAPAKIYKQQGDFPSGWLKEADLAGVAGISFAGLTEGQKTVAMQAVNERDCECGCNMGSIATCAKKDPNCPRSPTLVKLAIEKAKGGAALTAVLGAIDAKQKELGGGAAAGQAQQPAGPRKIEIASFNPRRGPKNAKVTIVEWSDFQCPFCGRATPTVKQVEEKYPRDVAVIFRHQPLPFHQNAMPAAIAAMAAGRQGKFWEMHDKLFGNQQALDQASIEKYAGEIGLNMARFKKDLDDPGIKDEIQEDSKAGTAAGANGTPTFFINGRELVGAQPLDAFQKVVDEEIKKADDLIKAGTPLADVYKKLMEQAAAAPPPAPAGAGAPKEPTHVDIPAGELADAPVKGSKSAPVTVVEFSDFQCPFCGRVVPTIRQIEDEYHGKVRVVWKNYPLPFHQNAVPAAEAAMAAHEQGKFWEMHDKLFGNQQALDRASIEKYAEEIGLNLPRFKAALDSGKFKERIDRESKYGSSIGVNGTPAFFINGTFLSGAQPLDAFKRVIDEELKKKGR